MDIESDLTVCIFVYWQLEDEDDDKDDPEETGHNNIKPYVPPKLAAVQCGLCLVFYLVCISVCMYLLHNCMCMCVCICTHTHTVKVCVLIIRVFGLVHDCKVVYLMPGATLCS